MSKTKPDHIDALYGLNSAMKRVVEACSGGNVDDETMFCELLGLIHAMQLVIEEIR